VSDVLEQDQEDFGARLEADSYFSDIPVLVQRLGVTESDINVALSTLNKKDSKIGACVVVLMPELRTDDSEGPAPRYVVRPTIQVIEQPLTNLDNSGTGKSAEAIATRVRQLLHAFSTGRVGTFMFDGMQPIAVDAGKISYGVAFRRMGGDEVYSKVARPAIAPNSGATPVAAVTLTCATAGAAIYYTTDGSYPHAGNATATLYAAPFAINAACTLRVAATKANLQQSDVAQAIFT
jgi:hypothetical protein